MVNNLLVIGGTGVISYAIVNEAVKNGIKVTCINRGRSKNQSLSSDVEVLISDYRDHERVKALLNNRHFDAVLDVLCYTPDDIRYSVELLKDCCDQYLFLSSAEAYNKPKYQDIKYSENVELGNTKWSYSINKMYCELELRKLAQIYNIKYTIIRPAITYGNTRIPYGLMPPYGYHGTLIHRLLSGKPIILWNDGLNYATFTHVSDFAVGCVGLIGNKDAYNQAVHISGDEIVTWKTVIEILSDIMEVSPEYVSIPVEMLAEEIPYKKEELLGGRGISQKLDNTKIKHLVPLFGTTICLNSGIKQTVDYYRQHDYLNGIDYKYDGECDRLVKKYSSFKNAKFIDYLGDATFSDKIWYLLYRYNNILVRCLRKVAHLVTNLFR